MKKLAIASLGFVPGFALAEVPAGVTTALSTLQTDAVSVAVIVLVATIAVMAVKFLRRSAH